MKHVLIVGSRVEVSKSSKGYRYICLQMLFEIRVVPNRFLFYSSKAVDVLRFVLNLPSFLSCLVTCNVRKHTYLFPSSKLINQHRLKFSNRQYEGFTNIVYSKISEIGWLLALPPAPLSLSLPPSPKTFTRNRMKDILSSQSPLSILVLARRWYCSRLVFNPGVVGAILRTRSLVCISPT